MFDAKLLTEKIEECGMPITTICEKSGIERATFYNRMNGKGDWNVTEVVAISNVLRLTKKERDRIFLS